MLAEIQLGVEIIKTPIQRTIEKALHILYEKDNYLIENDLHERSIANKLSLYLINEFQDWDVDVEYNRVGDDPKKIHEIKGVIWDEIYQKGLQDHFHDNMNVLPDIIIHKRGTRKNLVVLELKKCYSSTQEDEIDRIKLKCYMKERALSYKYAVFIKILKNKKHILEVYSQKEMNFG